MLKRPAGPLPRIADELKNPTRPEEMLLLRSIEWTTFDEATYPVALEQTNVILRYFLGVPPFHTSHF
jgi:nuclear pore complex protein Nup107